MFGSPSVRRRVRLLVSAVAMLSIAIGVTANLGTKRASALSEDVDKHVGEISGAVEFAKRADIEVDAPDSSKIAPRFATSVSTRTVATFRTTRQ